VSRPTLSVVLINYNYGRYIGRALQAIVDQSWQPLEVLVVDDCSTDNSVEVVEGFVERYPFVRLLRNEQNSGAVATANRGFQAAVGDYVCGAASDDFLLPGFFEAAMNLAARHPEAGLCCADTMIWDGTAEKAAGTFALGWRDRPSYLSRDEIVNVFGRRPPMSNAVILKRTALLEAGGYLQQLGPYCDAFLNLTVVLRYGACYVPMAGGAWRLFANNYSSAANKDRALKRQILEEVFKLLWSPAYSDIRPRFVRSRMIEYLRWTDLSVLPILLREPMFSPRDKLRLTWSLIAATPRQLLKERLPQPAMFAYRRLRGY
jgi:glycosyltransferase involved in cell wall biosynthesis